MSRKNSSAKQHQHKKHRRLQNQEANPNNMEELGQPNLANHRQLKRRKHNK